MRTTAAYASLNALETIYHMRKGDDESKLVELRGFLKAYVYGSDPIKQLWKNPAFHSAFTTEFQKEVNEIIPPHTLADTTSKNKAPKLDK